MAPNPSAVAIQAAIDGNLRLLKKMARKIDLREAKDTSSGQNVLHLAAAKGRLEVCRFLVEESGFDVNGTDANNGMTPVAHAAASGKVSVLRYLLDHGGDPAMTDGNGWTLHDAAVEGHCEALRLLLSRDVDVDPLNNRHITPLHIAATKGHDQALKVLLEHGADPNRVAHNMFSPLVMSCLLGSLKCMKVLVEAGADVNFQGPYDPTPLLRAVLDGSSADIVKFLLEAGADPNISDKDLVKPIMVAAVHDRRDLVEVLFPWTKPIACVPDWSVDGIMINVKYMFAKAVDAGLIEEHLRDDTSKAQGNEAFAKGDYLAACRLYKAAMYKDPLDATLFANTSLCWLRIGDGNRALLDAQKCRIMRPGWSKAWYHEGEALMLLKNYKGAANAFVGALKLEPENGEIRTALREAIEALRRAAHSGEQNP